jgi:hypothetical protein
VSTPAAVSFFGRKPLRFILTVEDADGDYPNDVNDAIGAFLRLGERDRFTASQHVNESYRAFLGATDIEPLDVTNADDIWRFVRATEALVCRRHRRDKDVYVQVLCECEWEPEHGLQLVFRRGAILVRVSEQDGHLTRADAYDVPDEEDEWLRRS